MFEENSSFSQFRSPSMQAALGFYLPNEENFTPAATPSKRDEKHEKDDKTKHEEEDRK